MATPALSCRLLRTPLLSVAEAEINLHSELQQRLLARLACAGGGMVSRSELVGVLWPKDPPRTALELLSSHVARLRAALAPYVDRPDAVIPRSERGYRLDPTMIKIDVVELADAASALRHDRSRPVLADARRAVAVFDRFNAEAAADQSWWTDTVEHAWDDLRWVVGALLDPDAGLDGEGGVEGLTERPDALLPMITLLADRRPFDEPVLAWRIRALVRSGRTAEALVLTDDVRRRLAEELGADPGPELNEAFRLALAGSASAEPEPPAALTSVGPTRGTTDRHTGRPRPDVPQQLPAPPTVFAGRDREVEALMAALHPTPSAGPALIMVTGPAGVGKSALAHVAASQVCDRSLTVRSTSTSVATGEWTRSTRRSTRC